MHTPSPSLPWFDGPESHPSPLSNLEGCFFGHTLSPRPPGANCPRPPLILRIFHVDRRVRSTIGYPEVGVKRARAPEEPLLRLTSFVIGSSFDLTGKRSCSLFMWGGGLLAPGERAGRGHVPHGCRSFSHSM